MSEHLVITVHGIRTFGEWQARLEGLLKAEDATIEVGHVDYGWFSVFAYVLVPFRWLALRRVERLFFELLSGREWSRVDVVAHSFGTYLAVKALSRLARGNRLRCPVHTLILAGSVLSPWFDWRDLAGRVKRIINECGIRDTALVFNLLLPFSGIAGRIGFRGVHTSGFRNRFFPFGHSGFFLTGRAPNAFMQTWWVPLLTRDEPARGSDVPGRLLKGWETVLLRNLEPVKVAVWTTFVIVPVSLTVLSLQNLTAVARSRQLAAEANEATLQMRADEALRAATAAMREASTFEAKSALLHALAIDPYRRWTRSTPETGSMFQKGNRERIRESEGRLTAVTRAGDLEARIHYRQGSVEVRNLSRDGRPVLIAAHIEAERPAVNAGENLGTVVSIAFNANGDRMAVAGCAASPYDPCVSGYVALVALPSGSIVDLRRTRAPNGVSDVAFGAGDVLAACAGDSVLLWRTDRSDGETVTLPARTREYRLLRDVTFSSTGRYVRARDSSGGETVWDLEAHPIARATGATVAESLPAPALADGSPMRFAAHGAALATLNRFRGHELDVWRLTPTEAAAGAPPQRKADITVSLGFANPVFVFTPDGRFLVAPDSQGITGIRKGLQVVSLSDGAVTAVIPLDVKPSAIEVEPKAQLIAVGATNGSVVLFDLARWRQIGPYLRYPGRSAEIRRITFEHPHRMVVTDSNGQVVRWTLDPKEWMQAACEMSGQRETLAQCAVPDGGRVMANAVSKLLPPRVTRAVPGAFRAE